MSDATGNRDHATVLPSVGAQHILEIPRHHTHNLHSNAIMEDTTMLEGSQGLFEEQSFTIIPNGLSDHDLDQVCDASKMCRKTTDAFYSYENRSSASAVP